MDNAITTAGTEQWEIESDEMAQVFEELADRIAEDREAITDGLAIEEGIVPPPPAAPWGSFEAAMRESEYVAMLAVAVTPSDRYVARPDDVTGTVRPERKAS